MQMGDYRLDHLVGFDLEKQSGLLELENRCRFLQKIMHGFGCQILACDPQENEELQQTNLSYTTLEDDVCKNSDVISVHCPLNPETKYMFNKSNFMLMKRSYLY
jgi:D-lactate dehydrogenase